MDTAFWSKYYRKRNFSHSCFLSSLLQYRYFLGLDYPFDEKIASIQFNKTTDQRRPSPTTFAEQY